jgi:hypothetical protein
MTKEEIEDRMETCPWRERPRGYGYVCTRYNDTIVPCDGCCSWVADYPKLKELEARKENKL